MDSKIATPILAVNDSAKAGEPVRITIESVAEEQTPIDPNSLEERAQLPNEPWSTSPLFYEMANFLGVDSREYEGAKDQISVITDWAIQQANSNKVEDIMHTIRGLEEKLQPPPWGERRYNHIYRALRMEARYDAAKKAMGAFSRTGKWSD